nr:MAG TPA: hypothetical protein [Caudoviricetes sp.]
MFLVVVSVVTIIVVIDFFFVYMYVYYVISLLFVKCLVEQLHQRRILFFIIS